MAAGRFPCMWASTADRDRSLEVVKASFAEGRLTVAELDLRLGQVLAARSFEELMALTGDLPGGPFGRLPAHRVTPAFRTGRLDAAATAALVLGLLALLIAGGAARAFAPGPPAAVEDRPLPHRYDR